MQTIATLAERLDMSAEEAVETLRKLSFEVEGVVSVVTDEQTDILIEVDEDPQAFETYLKEIKKKEEQARKRTERLKKAAKKAAAKKAAAKKAAAKKKTAAKKKAAVLVEESDQEKTAEIVEASPEAAELKEAKPAEEASEEKAPAEAEKPEVSVPAPVIVEEEETPSAPPAEEVAPTPETVAVVAPPVEAAPSEEESPKTDPVAELADEAVAVKEVAADKKKVIAEILPDEPVVEGATDSADPAVSVGDASEAASKGDADSDAPEAAAEEKPEVLGVLAEAERRQGEEDRRKARAKDKTKQREQEARDKGRAAQPPARPLPTPDPEVVAEVIRRAQERKKQKVVKQEIAKGGKVASETLFRGPAKKPALTGKAAKKRQRKSERARVAEQSLRRDAAAMVKEFQSGGPLGKKKARRQREEEAPVVEEKRGGTIEVEDTLTVEQVADAMSVSVNDLILELMEDNVLATKNQALEIDVIRSLAAKYDYVVQAVIPEEEDILIEEPDDPADLKLRAPVITVMGHVDHGKTSFLDMVRSANVADGEAGGITQHIAAYDVETQGGRIVFLDTPGHEAFTQMRARGAQATDVVVLVVAADDGVKPQTIEAIDHAKAAEVPIVVAVNKCDKPEAQPDRVRQELTQYELVAEEWGGKTIMKNISCKTGEGIEDLMEMLVLESQMLELKANAKKRARGIIVEAELSRGQGPVAWLLVQSGTLKVGDIFLCGDTYGRVRTMMSSKGKSLQEAGPSTPVLVTGFNDTAAAGDIFVICEEERIARNISAKRIDLKRQKKGPAVKRMSLEDFHERMQGVETKTLNIIIKADVQGSVAVLESSFAKLGNQEVSVSVVHLGVGGVNESDVLLASASEAVIIGFHVTANAKVQKIAEQEGIEIRTYRVIYEAIDEVRNGLEGMLAPDTKEVIVGHAEVRQVFRSSAIGNIAGSFQLDGETKRGSKCRLIRDSVVVHEGIVASVRRNKDDVKSVSTGYECGLKLERYNDIQAGDVIETYVIEEVAKKLVSS